ncbi:hypothetical protein UlMin_004194 [Ulmus minor]
MEALVVKLFAGTTSIKASYAKLQIAKNPYNSNAIQVVDQSVVDELKSISELKRSFLKKELDLSPQITMMLAEIQEQQSLMKTYEIMIKKLELEVDRKDSDLVKKLEDYVSSNKSLEKKLNASGPLPMLDNLQISSLNPNHFVQFLQHTLRSAWSFVKLMIPHASFSKSSHHCFAFESFISKTMFEGFYLPNFSLTNEHHQPQIFFETFKKLKSSSSKELL